MRAHPVQAFTQPSAHAIRAMTFLARQPAGEFQQVRVLAGALDLPAPFLAKILQPLAARGLLESQRGRGGGFRLARRPAEITLHQIVETQEPVAGPRQCVLGQAECGDDRACPLHDFWKRATETFHGRLAGTRLSDMLAFCERVPASGYPFPRAADREGQSQGTPRAAQAPRRGRRPRTRP